MNKTQLTREGYQKLEKELNELKNTKRPAAVDRLAKARSMGDLSENSEYVAAKEDLAFVDGRIIEIEQILNDAIVVENHNRADIVDVGDTVTVQSNGVQETYQVVGEYEADPMNKKLSSSSPIAKALLGKRAGDVVEIAVPAGKTTYKIIDIK